MYNTYIICTHRILWCTVAMQHASIQERYPGASDSSSLGQTNMIVRERPSVRPSEKGGRLRHAQIREGQRREVEPFVGG